jgi:hypothetical protein
MGVHTFAKSKISMNRIANIFITIVFLAAINPESMMPEIENEEMRAIASEIYEKLQRVISNL